MWPVADSRLPDADPPDTLRDVLLDAPLTDRGPDGRSPDVGMVDAGPDAFDAGCSASVCTDDGWMECSGGVLLPHVCNGGVCRDGMSGIGCYDFLPSNVGLLGYTWPLPPGEVLMDHTWNTDDCTGAGRPRVMHGACVLSFGDVEFSGVHTVEGSRPLVVISGGELTISGRFDADGSGHQPGPSGNTDALAGSAGSRVATYTDGGGAGGGGAFAGGGGGGVLNSVQVFTPPVPGGLPHDEDFLLVSLLGGGNGGEARTGDEDGGGLGGGGGGALQFSARGDLRLAGVINVSGGAGQAGIPANNWGAGGGGGGGGSILLESGTQIIVDSGEVLAAGGGGGGGASCSEAGSAGHEEDSDGDSDGGSGSGRDCHIDGIPGRHGYAANGGAGGTTGPGTDGEDENTNGGNGGGGGGGAGLVVVRAPADAALPGSGARRFTPSMLDYIDPS